MTNEEKIKYLNDFFDLKENFKYRGPKLLYKYRAFDDFSFDMIKNDYVYLCPAKRLDDPTECDVSFDLQDIYDMQNDGIKLQCVEKIIEQLKPKTSFENYKQVQNIIYGIINRDGTVKPNSMLNVSFELQKLAPNADIASIVNWIVRIPNEIGKPEIKGQIEKLFKIGYNAKEETGICSLCESNGVLEMWKEYANRNTGYCIEYDISNYVFNCGIFPVIYQDDRQTNILEQIVYNFIGQMIFGISNGQIDADKTQFMRLFLTKNTKWGRQREWRLLGGANERIKAPKIKAIYLGTDCSIENKKKMQQIAKSKNIEIVT